MAKYIIRRILITIPVLLGVIFVIFTITFFTPGEPGYTVLGATATEEEIAAWHEEVGLDKPYIVQLGTYIVNVFTKFDLGTSYVNSQPVTEQIMERAPVSIKLGLISTLLSIVIAIPLGILAAVKQNSVFDYMSTTVALFGSSMPSFWLAMILMMLFAVTLGWLPASGVGTFKHWILPSITAALFPIANIMRTTRSSVLEVIRQDYITTARAKGQTEGKIIKSHTLRNSIIPVVTVVGVSLSASLAGSLVVETVFSFPGLGLLLSSAIATRNYPVIRGCTVFYAVIVCIMNLIVDILYTSIDPRIKTQFFGSSKRGFKRKAKKESEVAA